MSSTTMMVQIEITTRCNFDCFYCAGRLMRQGDMPFELFQEILQRHIGRYRLPEVVSLQGEGEPTLHPEFFRMAEHARALGCRPYTITNGSHKHPEQFIGLFPQVGVSIDSIDPSVATNIGRYNLSRVITFVEVLARDVQIIVHSVAHQQYTPPVAAWCRERGYRHVVQPLQTKEDYILRYRDRLSATPSSGGPFSCAYLAEPRMRYYSLEGLEMPCCYIKDVGQFPGMDALVAHQRDSTWPVCCKGCRFGRAAT